MSIEKSPTQEAEQPAGAPRGLRLTVFRVGGPGWNAWREGALTRADELEAECDRVTAKANDSPAEDARKNDQVLVDAVHRHLAAARQAARGQPLDPNKRRILVERIFRAGPPMERAVTNLDAAEAQLLNFAPASYILDQMPDLLGRVQSQLLPTDPRRQQLERIAGTLGDLEDKENMVDAERSKIVTAMRAASSAALRERIRLRSFRNVVVWTTVVMGLLAIGVALTGFLSPTLIPLCFAPEESGQIVIVCPTAQSLPLPAAVQSSAGIDLAVKRTAAPADLAIVELVGLAAATVAAGGALRRLKGSSERYFFPATLAALKLPTGAITAFLGLLLMRGQFIPGLSALDTSAQILAWALVFGYGQQLFTGLVDKQAQAVLSAVRDTDVLERRVVERRISDKALAQIEQRVAGAVDQSVQAAFSGPALVDFEGWLGIEIADAAGTLVTITEDREVPLRPDHRYNLVVAIATQKPPGVASPLRITGGIKASTADFSVLLDSDDPELRQPAQVLAVPTSGGSASAQFSFETRSSFVPPWFWVRVAQRERVVQNVELIGISADREGEA
jgi:hypothetical protein